MKQQGHSKHKLSLPVFDHFRISKTINIKKKSVDLFALGESITTRNIEQRYGKQIFI